MFDGENVTTDDVLIDSKSLHSPTALPAANVAPNAVVSDISGREALNI